jgi:hypothetical protein
VQFSKTSFSFQFVDHSFIDELIHLDLALRFTVPVAHQFERIADAVALDTRRERKPGSEVVT